MALGIIALQNFDYDGFLALWHDKALNSPYIGGSYGR